MRGAQPLPSPRALADLRPRRTVLRGRSHHLSLAQLPVRAADRGEPRLGGRPGRAVRPALVAHADDGRAQAGAADGLPGHRRGRGRLRGALSPAAPTPSLATRCGWWVVVGCARFPRVTGRIGAAWGIEPVRRAAWGVLRVPTGASWGYRGRRLCPRGCVARGTTARRGCNAGPCRLTRAQRAFSRARTGRPGWQGQSPAANARRRAGRLRHARARGSGRARDGPITAGPAAVGTRTRLKPTE